MGNGEWGLRIEEDFNCSFAACSSSQQIRNQYSPFRIPYSPLSALPPLSSVAFTRAAASNKAFILAENW